VAKVIYNPTPTSIVLPLPASRRLPWQLGLAMALVVAQAVDQGLAAVFRPLLSLAVGPAAGVDRGHLLVQLVWMLPLTAVLAALPLALREGRRVGVLVALAVETGEIAVRVGLLAGGPLTVLPIGPWVAVGAAAVVVGLLVSRPARAFCDR
jgi:hypothetical protein